MTWLVLELIIFSSRIRYLNFWAGLMIFGSHNGFRVPQKKPQKDQERVRRILNLTFMLHRIAVHNLFTPTVAEAFEPLCCFCETPSKEAMEGERLSIYKAARTIKKRDNSLYNALRSIYEDSIFVGEISQLWRDLPLLANLRCGLWYSPRFHSTCYFKSTDGHNNNWSFNTSRLNLHVALLAGNTIYLSNSLFWIWFWWLAFIFHVCVQFWVGFFWMTLFMIFDKGFHWVCSSFCGFLKYCRLFQ